MPSASALPAGITVFERGWLSSNNVLLVDDDCAVLVDSGYATHAFQTVSLVERALGERPLSLLANTHLHSDHCGGNAALQARWPQLRTLIPPGSSDAVARWDENELTYAGTGQRCDRFSFDGLLLPGSALRMGRREWQVHAAPGHDPHSVVLFEPRDRILVSADALWQNGFGIVFPELEGISAFGEVGATLDVIERLAPLWVIPGHGPVFTGADEVAAALERARARLAGLASDPERHARHAAKVLLKFKLLELQALPLSSLVAWASSTPYFDRVFARYFADQDMAAWLHDLVQDLARSGAARLGDGMIFNA